MVFVLFLDVDDCVFNFCYNGGRCIDGQGWVCCECVFGFMGLDCKININECNLFLCSGGVICKDKINGFECICLLGKFGDCC